jgi:hypothetical protein
MVPLPVHGRVWQRQRRQVALLQHRGAQVAEQALPGRARARVAAVLRGTRVEAVVSGRAHARATHARRQVLPEQHNLLRVPPDAARVAGEVRVRHSRQQRAHEAAWQRRARQRRSRPRVARTRHKHKAALLQQRREAAQQLGQRLERICGSGEGGKGRQQRVMDPHVGRLTDRVCRRMHAPRVCARLLAAGPKGVEQKSPMSTNSAGGASAASKTDSTRPRLASTSGRSRKTSAIMTHISSEHAAAAASMLAMSAALRRRGGAREEGGWLGGGAVQAQRTAERQRQTCPDRSAPRATPRAAPAAGSPARAPGARACVCVRGREPASAQGTGTHAPHACVRRAARASNTPSRRSSPSATTTQFSVNRPAAVAARDRSTATAPVVSSSQ